MPKNQELLIKQDKARTIKDAHIRAHVHTETCGKDHEENQKGFGQKSITFWGSFCLNMNNSTGPAMVLMPLMLQQAGLITPVLATIIIYVLSTYSATMLCEAMQRIPGNFEFNHRYEFATVVLHYYGKKWYTTFQILYNLSLQASNIAAMVISAQVVDLFCHELAGASYALDYQQWPPKFIKSTGDPDHPWCRGPIVDNECVDGDLTFVLSLGYIICMAICIPFGYLNLDDNMWFQWFSFIGFVACTFEFWVQYIIDFNKEDKLCINDFDYGANLTCDYNPSNHVGNYSRNGFQRTPWFSSNSDGQQAVIGLSIFSCAYIVTIPSWVNEKKHHVSVNKAVWVPSTVAVVFKLLTGLLGAWAYVLIQPNGTPRDHSDDILRVMLLPNQPIYTRYAAYLWDITTIIPGIPVLAIMIRYNLLSGKVCGRMWSFFWGVVFPWIVTAFMYETAFLTVFCNWVAIIVQGFINFVIPCMLYRSALLRYPDIVKDPSKSRLEPPSETTRLLINADEMADKSVRRSFMDEEVGHAHGDNGACGHSHAHGGILRTLLGSSNTGVQEDPYSDLEEAPVDAIPHYVKIFGYVIWINRIWVANFMIWFFTILTVVAIVLNVANAIIDNS